jgi:succinate dehydrogenase / fumarate reductase flavoprotein subunit
MDMEFVQFHPTGMVWPPSVRGILVTEGVRGEGGVLKNSAGRRFMLDDIPENYRSSIADNEEEGWRYVVGDKSARRPPELLTRDHVARCIVREVKAGRGTPHGGVYLDIAWIKEKLGAKAGEHIKKKLPSMYHQFMQLAGVDITREPMEVGPTTHYMMGGVKVDGDTQMSTVPGLFAAGEVAAGLHGANRLGGNSLSDLLVFGKLAGEHAANFAKSNAPVSIDEAQIKQNAAAALAPFERAHSGAGGGGGGRGGAGNGVSEGPYQIQYELQDMMQANVGIVRTQKEMERALELLQPLKQRAQAVATSGNREYNPGWHTALDLPNLLTVSEAIAMSALDRKESRGAHFREDYPNKDDASFGKHNTIIRKGPDGRMQLTRQPLKPMRDDLKQVIETNK